MLQSMLQKETIIWYYSGTLYRQKYASDVHFTL